MTAERPLPSLLTAWRVRRIAWAIGGALLLFLVLTVLAHEALDMHWGAAARQAGGIALAALLPAAWAVEWHARRSLSRYEWSHLPGEGVVVRSGAWWHKEVWLPVSRLQHLDVVRGPLERRLGIATLALFTAGFQQHVVRLQGLDPGRALCLRDALLGEIRARHPHDGP